MRILMIIPQVFYSTRGTPISAYHRCRELIAHGHEVDILTYKLGADAPDLAARIYRSHGPHFAKLIKAGPSRLKIWFDLLLFFNLFYRLMVRRYDALYAHEEGALLARVVGGVFRTPYVYDMHSSLPRQILEWGFSKKQWVVSLFAWVERVSVRGARVVVAISPAVEQVARTVKPEVSVVVIVNHYDPPPGSDALSGAAVRERHGIAPTARLAVYTGSFVALQALDMLVAAAPIVRQRLPDVKFLLVGGTREEIELLSALAAKNAVQDCFIFEEMRPQREMAGYMKAADVLVSPRVAGINPPGKLFSYLASGKPVVAMDTLVHNQLLDSTTAILTQPTPQDLAEGIVVALTDPTRVGQVVAGAGEFLRSYCSVEARQNAYRTLAQHLRLSPKTLVVAPQPFFSPRGTPFSVYYRTLVMAEQGTSIDLLTYGEGEDVEIKGVRLVRIPRMAWVGPIPVGPSWKKLFLDMFMFWWTVALLVRHRYDVVHAHEESVFWCRMLKPIFRFRLIYDMHSSLPQQLSNFQFTNSRLITAIFHKLEDTCLRTADAVITICPDLKDYALRTGVPKARHLLIENSIFEDVRVLRGSSVDADQSVASLNLDKSRPIILYAGTFEHYQGVDILVQAFARLHAARPDVQLLVAGGTAPQVAAVQASVQDLGIVGAVLVTGRVSKSVAMQLTGMAQVLVSPRTHGTNTPLKIYEQLASGKPLVATRIWSHTQVLDDDVCFLVDPTPEALAAGLLRALNDTDAANQKAARARGLYEREYSRPVYEQKIKRLLEIVS